jgi:hypothetical protein
MVAMKIFLSYGREDEASARRLYGDLERLGHPPWFDRMSLTAAQRWKPAILRAIRTADFVVVLLSRKSTNRRGFLNREITEALDILAEQPESRPYLIPVMLEDCEAPHIALADLQWVNLYPDWDEGLRQIVKAVVLTGPMPDGIQRHLRAYMICRLDDDKDWYMLMEHVKRIPCVELAEPILGADDLIIIFSAPTQDAMQSSLRAVLEMGWFRDTRTSHVVPDHWRSQLKIAPPSQSDTMQNR